MQAGKVGIPVSLGSPLGGGILNPATLALLAGHTRPPAPHQTHEMTVPNELIGCIIGKGGSKVAEIRLRINLKSGFIIYLNFATSRINKNSIRK